MPEEITTNLFTNGKEWQTEDGIEYRGSYHRYITNEVYTGAVWNSKTSKKLKPYISEITRDYTYKQLKTALKTKYVAPWSVQPIINPTDITIGYINRYFIKKNNELLVIEIDKQQFDAHRSNIIDSNLYATVQLVWYISGPINDEMHGVVAKPGVRTKNMLQISYAAHQLPGVELLLTDPLQYYTDSDYKVPPAIN